jgi:hypothetical protein
MLMLVFPFELTIIGSAGAAKAVPMSNKDKMIPLL